MFSSFIANRKMSVIVVFALIFILNLLVPLSYAREGCCTPGSTCWPNELQLKEFEQSLDPDMKRFLHSTDNVPASAVVYGQTQPLFGAGKLRALYIETIADQKETCFTNTFDSEYCRISSRNLPRNKWTPAFVVFPLVTAHIQMSIMFAKAHNLCFSVAGTGHDFMNRHSSHRGMLIRTSLMKRMSWGKDTVTVGPGLTFAEIHKEASQRGRFIASGWSSTVGIVGWSIGGGHGPFGPSVGLGVDQILEATIVTANASEITVSESENHDLLKAIRGGGGSTFGVIVSLTLKTYPNPVDGFTVSTSFWTDSLCDGGREKLLTLVQKLFALSLTLDTKWSGLIHITPRVGDDDLGVKNMFSKIYAPIDSCKKYANIYDASSSTGCKPEFIKKSEFCDSPCQKYPETLLFMCPETCGCKGSWGVMLHYVYQGKQDDEAFIKWDQALNEAATRHTTVTVDHFSTWFERMKGQPIDYIYPLPGEDIMPLGMSSVLLGRDVLQDGSLFDTFTVQLDRCMSDGECPRSEFYQAITGNLGSPQTSNVSLSHGFRTAIYHFVTVPYVNVYLKLAPNSYFSESQIDMSDWKDRLWGSELYSSLLTVKLKYDPEGFFWCHQCVGFDLPRKVEATVIGLGQQPSNAITVMPSLVLMPFLTLFFL